MTKHTQGPWDFGPQRQKQAGGYVNVGPTALPEAVLAKVCGLQSHARLDHEQRYANARLIAAAPELLDALERLAEHICHDVDAPCGPDCEFVLDARDAIAKAKSS